MKKKKVILTSGCEAILHVEIVKRENSLLYEISGHLTVLMIFKNIKRLEICLNLNVKRLKINGRRLIEINCSKNRKDAKQFWRLIKDNSFGYELQSNSISGDKWVSHFQKVLCVPSSGDDVVKTNDILSGITHDCNNETLNVPITDDEVIHAVNHIRVSSSPGPDGISMHFYKNTLHLILPFLKTLFNEIFDSGNIPKDWGESVMVPVHKNGPRDDPNNYRGISLINSLCKIFTCILTFSQTAYFRLFHTERVFRRQFLI